MLGRLLVNIDMLLLLMRMISIVMLMMIMIMLVMMVDDAFFIGVVTIGASIYLYA